MGTDRTGVLVGEFNNPIMQYEVEATEPPRQGVFGSDFEIVAVHVNPETGIRGVLSYERQRRGISRLEQHIFRRIRTSIVTVDDKGQQAR